MKTTTINRTGIITFYLLFVCLSGNLIQAQNNNIPFIFQPKDYSSVQVEYQNGTVFGTNDFLKGINRANEPIDNYQALLLKFGKQRTGEKLWEQIFNYPTVGVGLMIGDFNNQEELGNPIAAYAFFHTSLFDYKRLSFNYITHLGLSFNWERFNEYTNIYNEAVGSIFLSYVTLGVDIEYELSKRIDAVFGISLAHYSNGNILNPNLGVNTFAPNFRLNYHFKNKPKLNKVQKTAFKRTGEWSLSTFGATKHLTYQNISGLSIEEQYRGMRYYMGGLSLGYNYSLGRFFKSGIGTSIIYNTSTNTDIIAENEKLKNLNAAPSADKIKISVNTSHELVIHQTSVFIQPSFYIRNQESLLDLPIFHQKIGLKYQFNNRLYGIILLNANYFSKADFIEWHVGYTF